MYVAGSRLQFDAKRGVIRFVFYPQTIDLFLAAAAAAEAFACAVALVYLFVQILLFLLGFCM